MSEEKIFAEGFIFKRRENAPEWVVGRLSIKIDEAIPFLKQYQKAGWVNLNIHIARSGNPYLELDTHQPKKDDVPQEAINRQLPKERDEEPPLGVDKDFKPATEAGESADDLPF